MQDLFPIGSTLDVYYNPNKPHENYVQRRPKSIIPLIFIGIAFLFLVASLLVFLLV